MKCEFEDYYKVFKKDKKLKKVIDHIGECPIVTPKRVNLFQSFVKSIIYQQLHAKAAQSIYESLLDHLKVRAISLKPEHLLRKRIKTLNSIGLSEAKARAIVDLAQKMDKGHIPPLSKLRKLSNEELIEIMTQVRGIGPWTVEMFMIFELGREDIASSGDFGLKKGLMLLKGLSKIPTPKEYIEMTKVYAPFRSIAGWYFWRVTDNPEIVD